MRGGGGNLSEEGYAMLYDVGGLVESADDDDDDIAVRGDFGFVGR